MLDVPRSVDVDLPFAVVPYDRCGGGSALCSHSSVRLAEQPVRVHRGVRLGRRRRASSPLTEAADRAARREKSAKARCRTSVQGLPDRFVRGRGRPGRDARRRSHRPWAAATPASVWTAACVGRRRHRQPLEPSTSATATRCTTSAPSRTTRTRHDLAPALQGRRGGPARVGLHRAHPHRPEGRRHERLPDQPQPQARPSTPGPKRCPTWRSRTTTCTARHASTVGPIDEEQRFYLESRGVPSDRRRAAHRGGLLRRGARRSSPALVALAARRRVDALLDRRVDARRRCGRLGRDLVSVVATRLCAPGRPGRRRGRALRPRRPPALRRAHRRRRLRDRRPLQPRGRLAERRRGLARTARSSAWKHGSTFDLRPARRRPCRPCGRCRPTRRPSWTVTCSSPSTGPSRHEVELSRVNWRSRTCGPAVGGNEILKGVDAHRAVAARSTR